MDRDFRQDDGVDNWRAAIISVRGWAYATSRQHTPLTSHPIITPSNAGFPLFYLIRWTSHPPPRQP